MLKFKREDLGLYFAFALVGGGVGLFAGAMLATYLERRKEEVAQPEKVRANVDMEDLEKQLNEYRKEEVDLYQYDFDKIEQRRELKRAPVEKVRKKNRKRENRSQYTDEEIEDFCAEFEPNIFQMEMLRTGQATMDEIVSLLETEEEAMNADPEDYNAPYKPAYYEDALAEVESEGEWDEEDLYEAVDQLDIINGRYELLAGLPENSHELRGKDITWHPEDNSFFYIRKGQSIPYDIRTSIGEDTWAAVLPWMLRGHTDLVLVDQEKPRYYVIHKQADSSEDESSDNESR